MRSINVMFKDKTVRRMKADEAATFVSNGKAVYVSQTIYKAVSAGISYDTIRDKRDDRSIKQQIQAITSKRRREQPVTVEETSTEDQRLSKAERKARRINAETGN